MTTRWMRAARGLAWLGIVVGVVMVGCGYALHHTTLVVRTDLAEGQPKAAEVETAVVEPAVEVAPDEDEAALLAEIQKEVESAARTWPPSKQPQTEVVGEAGLVRGAAMGTVVRLPSGQLALTWIEDGSGSRPVCYT